MAPRPWTVAIALACLVAGSGVASASAGHAHASMAASPAPPILHPGDVIADAKGCQTSIGLSLVGPHFNDGVIQRLWGSKVGPFNVADVKAYSGVQVVGIDGFVMVGNPQEPATGVWHAMSTCQSYAQGSGAFGMGWISALVDPPEWGRDNIAHHFFVVDHSYSDARLVDQVKRSTSFGLELNQALEASIGWPQPNVMHGRLHDAHHGLFEWQTPQQPAAPKPGETVRFWMLVHESEAVPDTEFGLNTHGFRLGLANAQNENRGNGEIEGRYYPVAFDLVLTDGQVRKPAESSGTFSHIEYCHHGHPEMEEEAAHGHGGASCQDTPAKFGGNANDFWTGGQTEAGLYWSGYDMTIKMGPDYSDHWFDVTWVH